MADDTSTTQMTAADMATQLAAIDRTALQAILDAAKAFNAAVAEAIAPVPTGSGIDMKSLTIANAVTSPLTFQVQQNIPALITAYTPKTAAPAAS